MGIKCWDQRDYKNMSLEKFVAFLVFPPSTGEGNKVLFSHLMLNLSFYGKTWKVLLGLIAYLGTKDGARYIPRKL